MLKNKILPTGIGHTTNCFLQVEGSDSNEPYLLTEDSDKPKSIQVIMNISQICFFLRARIHAHIHAHTRTLT